MAAAAPAPIPVPVPALGRAGSEPLPLVAALGLLGTAGKAAVTAAMALLASAAATDFSLPGAATSCLSISLVLVVVSYKDGLRDSSPSPMYAERRLDRENVGDGWAKYCGEGAGSFRFATGFRGIDILDPALKGGDWRLSIPALSADEGVLGAIEGAATMFALAVLL